MENIITIPIFTSLFLAILTLVIVTSSNCSFGGKVMFILFSTVFSFGIWVALPSYMGFATIEELPDTFVLVWASGDAGNDRIEVLMEPYQPEDEKGILQYQAGYLEKRFYRVKFNQKFNDSLEESMQKVNKGARVVYKRKGSGGKGGRGSGADKKEGSATSLQGYGEFIPHEELPPGMPSKD
jgi:hypothetical protein